MMASPKDTVNPGAPRLLQCSVSRGRRQPPADGCRRRQSTISPSNRPPTHNPSCLSTRRIWWYLTIPVLQTWCHHPRPRLSPKAIQAGGAFLRLLFSPAFNPSRGALLQSPPAGGARGGPTPIRLVPLAGPAPTSANGSKPRDPKAHWPTLQR